MKEPTVGQRFIVTKRVSGQRFRQTLLTNREKKSGSMSVATGTVLTFLGTEKGAFTERWRFSGEKLAGVEVRIRVDDARKKLSPLEPTDEAGGDAVSRAGATKQPAEQVAASTTSSSGFVSEELERLLRLKDAGALTDAEFADQKARVLAAQSNPDTPTAVAPPAVASANRKDIYLLRAGDRTISVIGALRDLTGASLAEAKSIVESTPQRILTGASEQEVDRARQLFDPSGATIRVQDAGSAFLGRLGNAPSSAPEKAWYLRPSTYATLALAWLMLFGLASCINWFRDEINAPASTSQPTQPTRPSPAPSTPRAPQQLSGQALQRVLDGLLSGAAQLGDFVAMYEQTGLSATTIEACLSLGRNYPRFEALPEPEGPNGLSISILKGLYFNAQSDCQEAIEQNDAGLFLSSVQEASEAFEDIVALYTRLSN